MHRVTGATWRAVGIGVVAVFLVVGFVGGFWIAPPHLASGTGASAAGSTSSGAVPARTYETSVSVGWLTYLGATTPIPQNLSFYANVTWGTISNADTKAWISLYDINSGTYPLGNISLNGTVNSANVWSGNNNGVLMENYTFSGAINSSNSHCSSASCANKLVGPNDTFAITATVVENGASAGGGMATGSDSQFTEIVATFTTATFVSPAAFSYNAIPTVVTVETNTSWATTTNTTFKSWLVLYSIVTMTASYVYSFNNTINTTNANGFSGTNVFSGYLGGVYYSTEMFTLMLNQTTLSCTTVSCNKTLPALTENFYQGEAFGAAFWVNENGSSVGGTPGFTGPYVAGSTAFASGSTIINAGVFATVSFPTAYQALPFTQTGWLNASWVQNTATAGNSTFTGYFQVWDLITGHKLATLSINDSANTTNSDGFGLSLVGNGTTPLGTPFVNYTWSLTLNASIGFGGTVPYDIVYVWANITANGNGFGGVKVNASGPIWGSTTPTLVQYPTTVSGAITTKLPAYVKGVPIPFNFTLAIANAAITPSTVTILLNITDLTTGALLSSNPIVPLPGQTVYNESLTSTEFDCFSGTCADLPQNSFQVTVYVTVDGLSTPLIVQNGSLAATNLTSPTFFVVTVPLAIELISPAPGASSPVGVVTISAAYQGSFTSGGNITIRNSAGTLVFSHLVVETGTGVFPPNATWFASAPGTYTYSITVTTIYSPNIHYLNGTISVYSQSTSSYNNNTVIPGLSGASAGTLLLLVGLIIGMIVAFVLGRAVWGGRSSTTPPQQWQGKEGEGAAAGAGAGAGAGGGGAAAAGTNVCSVCGKSFATPEELSAHASSEHGMQ
jgi:hypothetical protein